MNTMNPIKGLRSWYDNRVEQARTKDTAVAKEKYAAEIKVFEDRFEAVSQLDGTKRDENLNPGEVKSDSSYTTLNGERTLTKTGDGFVMRVSSGILSGSLGAHIGLTFRAAMTPFGVSPSQAETKETTEYRVNEQTGTISVTRDSVKGRG